MAIKWFNCWKRKVKLLFGASERIDEHWRRQKVIRGNSSNYHGIQHTCAARDQHRTLGSGFFLIKERISRFTTYLVEQNAPSVIIRRLFEDLTFVSVMFPCDLANKHALLFGCIPAHSNLVNCLHGIYAPDSVHFLSECTSNGMHWIMSSFDKADCFPSSPVTPSDTCNLWGMAGISAATSPS